MMLSAGAPILLIKGINSINRFLDLKKEGLAGAGPFFVRITLSAASRHIPNSSASREGGQKTQKHTDFLFHTWVECLPTVKPKRLLRRRLPVAPRNCKSRIAGRGNPLIQSRI
jgi:hypothetical protein